MTNIWHHRAGVDEEVAAIFDPFGNAVHTALSFAVLGEDVLVTGAGPIGCMAAAVVRHAGARHVVVTDLNPYRLELARRMGATLAVDPRERDLGEVQSELGMSEGFDVGLEMSGQPGGAPQRDREHGPRRPDRACSASRRSRVALDLNPVIFDMLTIKGIYGREMYETWYQMSVMLAVRARHRAGDHAPLLLLATSRRRLRSRAPGSRGRSSSTGATRAEPPSLRDPQVVVPLREPRLIAAQGIHLHRPHDRPVLADRAALHAPPAEPQRLERHARDPPRREQVALPAPDDGVPAERVALAARDQRAGEVQREQRDQPAASPGEPHPPYSERSMYGRVRDELSQALAELREAGTYKSELVMTTAQGAHVEVEGRGELLNLCANNYLGLANHPAVIAAAHLALDRWGYGMASVRFICGTQALHRELEERL